MRIQRIISVLLVFLLIPSITVPAVSADGFAAPVVAAIPEVASIVIGGVTVVMTGVAALKIAENLGKTWDNTMKGWDQLMQDTGAALNNLFAAPNWVGITTDEGKAVMDAVYEYYTVPLGGGGKKDDKWYFEARLNHGKLEINTERMDETQAVKEMGRGKNIMTLTEKMAQNIVGRFQGLSKQATKKLKFEGDHNPTTGYFHHLHYEAKGMRLHCWSWK